MQIQRELTFNGYAGVPGIWFFQQALRLEEPTGPLEVTIADAAARLQTALGRTVFNSTWTWVPSEFGTPMVLPKPAPLSVKAIEYKPTGEFQYTQLDASACTIEEQDDGSVTLSPVPTWPAIADAAEPIKIAFETGGLPDTNVLEPALQRALSLDVAAHFFNPTAPQTPDEYWELIMPFKRWNFGGRG